ncbi:MAG: response regulator transcription factor, partial [Pseudomonadota bacterium]
LKSAPPEALCDGIRAILAGETVFPEGSEALSLSPREIQTLEAIAAGKTNAAIAEALSISIKTVDSHRTSLMRKLGVHSTASLIVCAVREGLIDP